MENQKPIIRRDKDKSAIWFETEEDFVWCRPCTDAPDDVAEWLTETFPYLDDAEISALIVDGWELAEAEEIDPDDVMEHLNHVRKVWRMVEIIEESYCR